MKVQKDAAGSVSPLRVRIFGVRAPGACFGPVSGVFWFSKKKNVSGRTVQKDAPGPISPLRVRIGGVWAPGPSFLPVFGVFRFTEKLKIWFWRCLTRLYMYRISSAPYRGRPRGDPQSTGPGPTPLSFFSSFFIILFLFVLFFFFCFSLSFVFCLSLFVFVFFAFPLFFLFRGPNMEIARFSVLS